MYNFLEQLSLFVSFAPWFNKPSYWSQFRIECQDFELCLAQYPNPILLELSQTKKSWPYNLKAVRIIFCILYHLNHYFDRLISFVKHLKKTCVKFLLACSNAPSEI
jgi:hypothetical protein